MSRLIPNEPTNLFPKDLYDQLENTDTTLDNMVEYLIDDTQLSYEEIVKFIQEIEAL